MPGLGTRAFSFGLRFEQFVVGKFDLILVQAWVIGLSDQTLVENIVPIPSEKHADSAFTEMVNQAIVIEKMRTLQTQMERVAVDVAELEKAVHKWENDQDHPTGVPSSVANSILTLGKHAKSCEHRLHEAHAKR